MKKCVIPLKVLLIGLLVSQIIATIQVFLSNTALYNTLVNIRLSGYLAVPNLLVMHSLKELGSAFMGGVFFTLTIGAGLSILGFAAAWAWEKLFSKNIFVLICMASLWLLFVVWMNLKGFHMLVSAYVVFVPPAVFWAALKWMPKTIDYPAWKQILVAIMPIFLLYIIWAAQVITIDKKEGLQFDESIFIRFRDNALLTNPVGAAINDFYYKYTLYPAEVIKTLDQKLIRTCVIEVSGQKLLTQHLENILLRHNWLVVDTDKGPGDVAIFKRKNELIFKHNDHDILSTTVKSFFSDPQKTLQRYSKTLDQLGPFRKVIFYSLLTGLPITIYVLLFTLFCLPLSFFFQPKNASITAAVLCILCGIWLVVPFHIGHTEKLEEADLGKALTSQLRQERSEALRLIYTQKKDIAKYAAYEHLLKSTEVTDRYWLAKAMGRSKRASVFDDLLILLDDPHTNVVCMAIQAIGKRKDPRSTDVILKKIRHSLHWYEQWYAYKALRTLGWKQKKLN